jgi:hypothetical protein
MEQCIASAKNLVAILPDCAGGAEACRKLQESRFVLVQEKEPEPLAKSQTMGHFFAYYGASRDSFSEHCLGKLCDDVKIRLSKGDLSVRWRSGDELHDIHLLDLQLDLRRMMGKQELTFDFPDSGVSVFVHRKDKDVLARLKFLPLCAAEIEGTKLMMAIHRGIEPTGSSPAIDFVERMALLLKQAEDVAMGMQEGKRQYAALLSDNGAMYRMVLKKPKV